MSGYHFEATHPPDNSLAVPSRPQFLPAGVPHGPLCLSCPSTVYFVFYSSLSRFFFTLQRPAPESLQRPDRVDLLASGRQFTPGRRLQAIEKGGLAR